jgi:hypothetical protein
MKKERKLMQIGTKLGKKHHFTSYNILCGKDHIEMAQILGIPKWEFEIMKLLISYESCDFGGS